MSTTWFLFVKNVTTVAIQAPSCNISMSYSFKPPAHHFISGVQIFQCIARHGLLALLLTILESQNCPFGSFKKFVDRHAGISLAVPIHIELRSISTFPTNNILACTTRQKIGFFPIFTRFKSPFCISLFHFPCGNFDWVSRTTYKF